MKMHVRYATAAAAILVPVWGSSGDNRTMVNDFSQVSHNQDSQDEDLLTHTTS